MREATPVIQLDRERLSRLDKLARQMSSKETDLAAWAKANTAFHWEIYEASPMPRMKSILSSLLAAVEPFVRLSVGDVDELALAQTEHLQLLRHIRDGDAEAGADLIQQHLLATLRLIESAFPA